MIELGEDGWPKAQSKSLSFSDLADPLIAAVRFAYTMRRRNANKDIPWTGPNIGRSERACCLDAAYSLTEESLTWVKEGQGRDALTEIIGLALRLGIEQGRRIMRDSPEYHILVLKAAMADYQKGEMTEEKLIETIKNKGEYDVFNRSEPR